MQNYEYSTLDDPAACIRLLRLLPVSADQGQNLQGELITCRRDEAPPYQPVSYTWGQQDASSTILLRDGGYEHCSCHGDSLIAQPPQQAISQLTSNADTFSILTSRSTELDFAVTKCTHTAWRRFSIRPNLEALLRRFGSLPGPKIFWVDAICMNQSDNHEKGHQVRNMDKIYRDRRLLIWLGEPTENSDLAIDLIEACGRCFSTDGSGRNYSNTPSMAQAFNDFTSTLEEVLSWKAFVDLIRRPWFTRRWIVQEFILSKHKHVYIGNRDFCFEFVMYICCLLDRRLYLGKDERQETLCKETGDASQTHVHGFPAPALDPIDNLNRLWNVFKAKLRGETAAFTLERLLDNFASFESCDPRDGVYAFLSMASDVHGTEWIPDYSEKNTVTDIYSKAVLHIMRSSSSLDVICRRAHWFEFGTSVSHPSRWIPWFGPQKVEFWPGHVHSIHGYNTKSLTTFGEPLSTLREGQEGHYSTMCQDCRKPHRGKVCDGCEMRIEGTGYKCLDCPDFDYCYRCIGKSASDHDSTHRFELFNKAVYFASGCSTVHFPPDRWYNSCTCKSSCGHFIPLYSGGFLVDSVQGVGKTGDMTYSANDVSFTLPLQAWMDLPGMKAMCLDKNGKPGEKFFRTLTGNRRVVDGRVCHVPDDELHVFMQAATSHSQPQLKDENHLSSSVAFMLSNSRRFATTQNSLGFVPNDTKVGDHIAILIGCSVPVVIREIGGGKDKPMWQLVGECYIDGFMEGEYMDVVRDRMLPPQAITIV